MYTYVLPTSAVATGNDKSDPKHLASGNEHEDLLSYIGI